MYISDIKAQKLNLIQISRFTAILIILIYHVYNNSMIVNDTLVKQNDSAAADVETLKSDFNALLTKLKNAGIMSSE